MIVAGRRARRRAIPRACERHGSRRIASSATRAARRSSPSSAQHGPAPAVAAVRRHLRSVITTTNSSAGSEVPDVQDLLEPARASDTMATRAPESVQDVARLRRRRASDRSARSTAPVDRMPRSAITHSGRLSDISATRSPRFTPSARGRGRRPHRSTKSCVDQSSTRGRAAPTRRRPRNRRSSGAGISASVRT